ncbi:hypothetical protein RintRC_0194 [Richelia intracellularis]|nr:hypothetical protein RintRC_0194 [Richelia intracellularis]
MLALCLQRILLIFDSSYVNIISGFLPNCYKLKPKFSSLL